MSEPQRMADPVDERAYLDALGELEPDTDGLAECEAKRYLEVYKQVRDDVAQDPWIAVIRNTPDSEWSGL